MRFVAPISSQGFGGGKSIHGPMTVIKAGEVESTENN